MYRSGVSHVRRRVGRWLFGGQAGPQLWTTRNVLGIDFHRRSRIFFQFRWIGRCGCLLDRHWRRRRTVTLSARNLRSRLLLLGLHPQIQRLFARLLLGDTRSALDLHFSSLRMSIVVALRSRLNRRSSRRRPEGRGSFLRRGRRDFVVLRQHSRRGETFLFRTVASLLGFFDFRREQQRR